MVIPKLKFVVGKVEDYYQVIEYFVKEDGKEMFLPAYPDMPNKGLKEYFLKKEVKFMSVMGQIRDDFEKSWNLINDKVFLKLGELMDEKWDESEFIARVTLLPICPRYLDHNTFDLNLSFADITMKTICLHELSHFLFFNKIKKLFPDVDKRDFEKPGIWWEFSEILPGVIFDSFEIFKIQEEVIVYNRIRKSEELEVLGKLYQETKTFEDFLKKGHLYLSKSRI